MEKMSMCRICLAENVRMYIVVNRNLHELYEKLTDIPFVTEDNRPILACFFCCAKLKQCYQLLRQCLEAEELFAQMMNEPNLLISQAHLEFCGGLIKSPIVHISIDDECETESTAIKEEIPAVCEGVDDVIEPKEEHQNYELEPENLDNSCLDVSDIPPHHSESDIEDDVPLMELKTIVEDKEVSNKKRRARDTKKRSVQHVSHSPHTIQRGATMTTRNLIQKERNQIIVLHRQGLNISQIAVELNMQLQELCGLRPCGSYKQKALITLYELRRVLVQILL